MAMSWGIMLPLGMAIARYGQAVQPKGWWFKMHRGIQSVGLIIAVIAFGLAIDMVQEKSSDLHFVRAHHQLGLAVMIVGLLQPINAFIRPHVPPAGSAKSTPRRVWEFAHKNLGRLAIIGGFCNVVIGLNLDATKIHGDFQVALSVIYYLIFVAAMALVVLKIRGLKQLVRSDSTGKMHTSVALGTQHTESKDRFAPTTEAAAL